METADKIQITLRVKKESWEAVASILQDTGLTPNLYISMLIDSLAMSETKSYKDLMNYIVNTILGEGIKKKKKNTR